MRFLATTALIPAGATLHFFLFWRWFEYWRKHRVLTYTMIAATYALLGVALYRFGGSTFGFPIVLPIWVRAIGWALLASTFVFGWIADRQIGFRVRSFTPFFEPNGKIQLKTSLAYGLVRHPLYASGIGWQVGAFLATGYPSILVACSIFTLGALWFTRQEERRLRALLDDPTEYDRYRARVPALFPFIS